MNEEQAAAAANSNAVLEAARKKLPNIAFIIERSKNLNVVVYEALVVGDGKDKKLKAEKPIDAYWLDQDPEYVKAARASGKQDDRVELGMFESKLAYGLSWTEVKDKPGRYKLNMVAVPKQHIEVYIDENGDVVAETTIDGKACRLERIYVYSVEGWVKPTVMWVQLCGTDLATGEARNERQKP
jgi:Domain of unknown function (DUF4833)